MNNYIWLIAYAWPHKNRVTVTWLISVAIVILQLLSLWISVQCIHNILIGRGPGSGSDDFLLAWLDKVAIELLSTRPPYETLVVGALSLAVLLFTISLLKYLKSYIYVNINERILVKIRFDIFHHITTLDLLFTQTKKTGEIESLLFHDVDNLTWGLLDSLDRLFLQPLRIVIFTYLLCQLSPILTLLLYAVLSLNFILTHYLGRYLESRSRILMEKTANLHGSAVEYLILAVLARIFNNEDYETERWHGKCHDLATARIRSRVMQDLFPILTSFFKSISLLLIILIGGNLVYRDATLAAIDLARIMLLVPMLLYPMEAMATLYGSVRMSLASIKRIRKVFAETTAVPSVPLAGPYQAVRDPIYPLRMHEVSKAIGGRVIVKNVKLIIEKYKTIVIYGPSGSGKSTLLSLLAGLSQPDNGAILIGDHSLAETDQHSWRDRLSIVLQDSLFFNATIRQNLAYSAPACSDEEMMQVLERVFPHDAAFRQPAVLDTEIGNLGKNLSGGERQRLSIARALLKKPDLLILDEPTSDLDQVNRDLIYEILKSLGGTLTMIVATHDAQMRKLADHLFCIKDSTLVETENTHGI